jgi:hypothetical protein
MIQNNKYKLFKRKKPFNNGFKKPMQSESLACISCLQPPTAAKRQKAKYEIRFYKKPSQVPKCSKNTKSLESILKGKVIKEFLPLAQKEQRAPELIKIA